MEMARVAEITLIRTEDRVGWKLWKTFKFSWSADCVTLACSGLWVQWNPFGNCRLVPEHISVKTVSSARCSLPLHWEIWQKLSDQRYLVAVAFGCNHNETGEQGWDKHILWHGFPYYGRIFSLLACEKRCSLWMLVPSVLLYAIILISNWYVGECVGLKNNA